MCVFTGYDIIGYFIVLSKVILFFVNFFLVYLFLRQRERESMNGGGAEREGDTESEAGSRL